MSNCWQDWDARSFIPRNCWPARWLDAATISVMYLDPRQPCRNRAKARLLSVTVDRRINLPEMYLQIESLAAQFCLQLGSSGGGLPSGRSAINTPGAFEFFAAILRF